MSGENLVVTNAGKSYQMSGLIVVVIEGYSLDISNHLLLQLDPKDSRSYIKLLIH